MKVILSRKEGLSLLFLILIFFSFKLELCAEEYKTIALNESMQKLTDWVFNQPHSNLKTIGFYLLKDGEVQAQKFTQDPNKKVPLWSISKTISVVLLGAMQKQKALHRKNSLGRQLDLKPYKIDDLKMKQSMTLSHLATMSSGLKWRETYERSPFNSNVVRMLYFEKQDVTKYILSHPNAHAPGEVFSYSSGDTNLLMDAIGRESKLSQLEVFFPWQYLFDPLKINATFETDQQGVYLGSSYVYMSILDLAKIAQLILNQGTYEGKEYFSQEFYQFMLKGHNNSLKKNCNNKGMSYGAGVWVNQPCKDSGKRYLNTEDDVMMLLGHFGQSVFILPKKKIIAIRMARDKSGKKFDRKAYFELLNQI